ncbi:MAG: hypothetical protein Q9227_004655 [Pyrenula ochraceoflavens]
MARREARFDQTVLIDTTPMPSHIPSVPEIGASSAPLMSAAYFIGARCKDYNDDYMQCKTESYGRGELDCMKEGRRGLEKTIPDAPKNSTPIHLREKQIFADRSQEILPFEKGASKAKEEPQPQPS